MNHTHALPENTTEDKYLHELAVLGLQDSPALRMLYWADKDGLQWVGDVPQMPALTGETLAPEFANFIAARFPCDYPAHASKLFKPADTTAADLAKCSGYEAQMVHVALGLAGEWFEYKTSTSRANMLEELGDFWFFYNAGRQVMNLLPASDAMRDAFAGVYGHVEATGLIDAMLVHLLDYAKKPAIYRKPVGLSDELISYYNSTHAAFVAIIEHHGFTLQEVEAANVAKLSKRYVKGYSNEAAQARADKVE